MRTFSTDKFLLTNSEWFVGIITEVGDREELNACSNFPCSWVSVNPCDNYQTYNIDDPGYLYGDINNNYNVAYPIQISKPNVGDICLFRLRGIDRDNNNIYEFIFGGTAQPTLALTAIQCSGGILSSTYSDGCVRSS